MGKKYWLFLLLIPLILVIIVYIMINDNKTKLNTVEEVLPNGVAMEEIRGQKESSERMHKFITSNLPYGTDAFMEIENGDKKVATLAELRREALNDFYLAIQYSDLDYFTSTVSGDVLQELWGDVTEIEERIELMKESLKTLGRDGQLKTILYHFEVDTYDTELDSGILYLEYTDGMEVPIEFELERIGDDRERYYQIITSMEHMNNEITQ